MNIYIVDAFTEKPYRGNPAAVCILESEPSAQWMQEVANEMNLSETAFLLEQDGEFSLRWFTPETEVDLCGHATLASAHVLWKEGYSSNKELRFRTKSGILTANQKGDWIQMNFPLEEAEQDNSPPDELILGLGSAHTYVGRNRLDYLIEVEDEEVVKNLQPDFSLWKLVSSRGVIVTSRSDRPHVDFVSRCFYPALGVNEDPVTGSAHCCLGPFWRKRLNKNNLTALQLSKREGILQLTMLEERILLSGQAITTMKGTLVHSEAGK